MRRISTIFFVLFVALALDAQHIINTQGLSYSPDVLTVQVGDEITINASGTHPTTQVSEVTWNNNGTTPLAGGFAHETGSFTFTATEVGTIFYICDSHIGAGMKGRINVGAVGIEEQYADLEVSFGELPVVDGTIEYRISGVDYTGLSLTIVGLNGQEIVSEELSQSQGNIMLDASAGVYVVLLKESNGQVIRQETISVK